MPRIRLIVLAALSAAFLLVPAAQALAAESVTVTVEGSGSGEVSSVGGYDLIEPGTAPGAYEGTPPIECAFTAPATTTGNCVSELDDKAKASKASFSPPSPPPAPNSSNSSLKKGRPTQAPVGGVLNLEARNPNRAA